MKSWQLTSFADPITSALTQKSSNDPPICLEFEAKRFNIGENKSSVEENNFAVDENFPNLEEKSSGVGAKRFKIEENILNAGENNFSIDENFLNLEEKRFSPVVIFSKRGVKKLRHCRKKDDLLSSFDPNSPQGNWQQIEPEYPSGMTNPGLLPKLLK